jgi:hypothetical protein
VIPKAFRLSLISGLCVLVVGRAQADGTWHFESASGSGPYPVDTPVDAPIQDGSQLSLLLFTGVAASIASGATSPASGNYLFLQASSQAIDDTRLVFTLTASGPVEIDSLSYAAVVFKANQGPSTMNWVYSVNYGSANIGPTSLTVDTYKQDENWNSYNSDFNIITSDAATVTIVGTLGGADTLDNKNGNVGFDAFSFNIVSIPEPSTGTLLVFGLVLAVSATRKVRRNCHALPGDR